MISLPSSVIPIVAVEGSVTDLRVTNVESATNIIVAVWLSLSTPTLNKPAEADNDIAFPFASSVPAVIISPELISFKIRNCPFWRFRLKSESWPADSTSWDANHLS